MFLVPRTVYSAFERLPLGVAAAGRAGAGLAMPETDGFLMNPAQCSPFFITASWSEPYGLKELGAKFIGASHKAAHWGASISAHQTGDEVYREQEFRATGATHVSQDLDLGVAVQWRHLEIETLPSGEALSMDVGVRAKIQDGARIGAVWRNPTRARLSNYEDRLPEALAVGISVDADSRTVVALDAVQESGYPLELRGGVDVQVLKPLTLRGGVQFNPGHYALGFTLRQQGVRVNYALQWHRTLGASHFVGLGFSLR